MNAPVPAEGTLLREQGSSDVFVMRGGARLRIPSSYTFDALGYKTNAVKDVPAGSLAHIPVEEWPSASATPGSVVFVPDHLVYHPIPVAGSKLHRAWGKDVRTVELRGWLVDVDPGCNGDDPDWHYNLFLDAAWALEQGMDLNQIFRAGAILQMGRPEPGSAERARVASPRVHLELHGYPIKGEAGRKEPPDWATVSGVDCPCVFLPHQPQAKWPCDPRNPRPGDEPLADGQYVRVVGSLVTDQPHVKDFVADYPELELWNTGWPQKQNNRVNFARWTELHPPDTIEVVDRREPTDTFRGVAVVAPGTFNWRPRPETTLDVEIPAPPRPPGNQTLRVQELVGAETDFDMIVEGNSTRTGARVARLPNAVRLFVRVTGRRSVVGGSPGRFKALYRIYWAPAEEPDPTPTPPLRVTCVSRRRQLGVTSIVGYGGLDAEGDYWHFPRETVITLVGAGWRFYVEGDRRADLVVVRRLGRKYVRTAADGLLTNNLGKLPRCA